MYDLLIKNGTIFDGSGAPSYKADIGVKDGRIAFIGHLKNADAKRVIDAYGLAVAPGFIDIHTHDDLYALQNPSMDAKLMQGVTTVVGGNCGFSLYPMLSETKNYFYEYTSGLLGEPEGVELGYRNLVEYFNSVHKRGAALNVASLLGHGTVRVAVMGYDNRAPTEDELERMKALVREAMEEGAVGMSLGLSYTPGCYAKLPEMIELARIVGEYGGYVPTHMRSCSRLFEESVAEMVTIAEAADVPVHISHFKAFGDRYLDKAKPMLEHLEKLHREGVDVTIDAYPYYAGSTNATILLPPWSMEGGVAVMLERLKDIKERERIKKDIETIEDSPNYGSVCLLLGWNNIVIAAVAISENKQWENMSLEEIGKRQGKHPADVLLDLLLSENAHVTVVTHETESGNLELIMKSNLHMFMTDGIPVMRGKVHPRLYGTFARVLGKYVRVEGTLSLENAVRKMSYLPANRACLYDRGLLRPGMAADITIFDPKTIIDKGTYADPAQTPDGILYVIVNGAVTVDGGRFTGVYAGQTLKRQSGGLQKCTT